MRTHLVLRWRPSRCVHVPFGKESPIRTPALFAAAVSLTLSAASFAQEKAPPPITRDILPGLQLPIEHTVDRVEVQKISMAANQKPGAHVHSVPVIGYVIEGMIRFQIGQQPEQILSAGDAFFEPAGAVVTHFDSGATPAKFIAYYLLGKGEKNGIKMTP